MQENKVTSLREMLEQLPTEQLDKMLHMELQKEPPDPDAVRLILSTLEEREKDLHIEPTPQQLAAWEKYQQRIGKLPKRKPGRRILWQKFAALAATFLIVLMGTFAIIPQEANAEGFWGMLSRWKESFLEFFDPEEKRVEAENGYNTDHPGLQQVHDVAVTELGIENPMLPEWFPEEIVLESCDVIYTPNSRGVFVLFFDGNGKSVLNIDIYNVESTHQYYRDDSYDKTYEKDGRQFDITRNIDKWIVVWTKDSAEYSIAIDCQEDTLQRILESIYVMEEN